MEPTTVRVADVDPVEMMSGVQRRTLATGERMMIAHMTLGKGAAAPLHSHPHEQVGYVIEGRIRMTIGGEVHEFEPGDSYFIPGDLEHDAVAITDCVVLDIFSPPREEYRRET
jgi:quercetin dioxygenase-like cupin family protein